MLELSKIRADLREIRYYYTRKKIFDETVKIVGASNVAEKALKYNEVIKRASPQMYDLYVGLYINGLTQEAFAESIGYASQYVQYLHKQLLLFFQEHISG